MTCMSIRWRPSTLLAVAMCASGIFLAFPGGASPAERGLAPVLERWAPSIVTVKVVLEAEINSMGEVHREESREELQGSIVDPSGIVMVSNTPLSTDRFEEMWSAMGEGPPEGFEVKLTPQDITVVVGTDGEELPAFLVARDTVLDLAFLQMESLGDRKLAVVAFDAGERPPIGEEVACVVRLNRGFGYAPYVETGRIAGFVSKPREAWLVDGSVASLGLPVFDHGGRILGAFVSLSSGIGNESSGNMGGMMGMLSPGARMNSSVGTFIVPARAVNALVVQVRERAARMIAERKAQEATGKPVEPTPGESAGPAVSEAEKPLDPGGER